MAAPVFTDGVTPLNAATFNALGAEVNTKLAAPAVVNGQWIKGVGGAAVWAAIASTDVDWFALPFALTYTSTDGHTFVCATAGDMTALIPVGARIRLTDAAATKYFIVTAITAATITLYGGQNYALAGGAITVPFYSQHKAPLGFPLDPIGWTEILTDTALRTQASPTISTWYNPGALSLVVPIGSWRLSYQAVLYASIPSSASTTGNWQAKSALSTANNSASDLDLVGETYAFAYNAAAGLLNEAVYRDKNITLAAKATYFLNAWANWANVAFTNVGFDGTAGSSVIRAVCNYL